MKYLTLLAAALLVSVVAFSQAGGLPDTQIKDVVSGKRISFNNAVKPGRVTLVSFWATWCVPCKKEIKNVREKMAGWKEQADFDFITVSIDETRAEGLVRSYAKSQGWEFPAYIDPNSDLKRSLNFQTVPFTMVIGKDGKVAYMHSGYEEGAENETFEKVKELATK
jgi:thiol-disulfide isomerase/thioredoxin